MFLGVSDLTRGKSRPSSISTDVQSKPLNQLRQDLEYSRKISVFSALSTMDSMNVHQHLRGEMFFKIARGKERPSPITTDGQTTFLPFDKFKKKSVINTSVGQFH